MCRYVNKRNLSGFTPLHYAVWGCSEQVVQQVLQASPDISAANDRVFDAWVTVPVGSTALHLAVVRNDTPIALMLLQHYVSPCGSDCTSRLRCKKGGGCSSHFWLLAACCGVACGGTVTAAILFQVGGAQQAESVLLQR